MSTSITGFCGCDPANAYGRYAAAAAYGAEATYSKASDIVIETLLCVTAEGERPENGGQQRQENLSRGDFQEI